MTSDIPPETRCHVCNTQQNIMKRCTRCRAVMYCSHDCQVKDWPSHQQVCKKLRRSKRQRTESRNTNAIRSISTSKCIFDEDSTTDSIKEGSKEGNTHPPLVDFSKALKKPAFHKPEGKCYLHRNQYHTDIPEIDDTQPTSKITVRCNKDKHNLVVQNNWNGLQLYKFLSYSLQVPLEKMKIIHKGKVLSQDSISETVKNRSVYQVIGQNAESEDGIDQRDISIMMKQMNVDRNEAVLALKKKGDLLDALLDS